MVGKEQQMMPPALKWGVAVAVSLVVGSGLYLWAVRGHAVLLDLASNAVALLCP